MRQVRLKVRSRAKFPREFKSISARFRSEKNVIYGVRMSSRTRERCLSASISATQVDAADHVGRNGGARA